MKLTKFIYAPICIMLFASSANAEFTRDAAPELIPERAVREVGTGDNSIPLVISFANPLRADNPVLKLKYDGELPANVEDLLKIIDADPAIEAKSAGASGFQVSLDASARRKFDNQYNDGFAVSAAWSINKTTDISGHEYLWLTADTNYAPPYFLYLPETDEVGVWMPDNIAFSISDEKDALPFYIQIDSTPTTANPRPSVKVLASDTEERPTKNTTSLVKSFLSTQSSQYINYNIAPGFGGTIYTWIQATAKIDGKSVTLYSNMCTLDLHGPKVPMQSAHFYNENLTAVINTTVDNPIIVEPENTTYTGFTIKSGSAVVCRIANGQYVMGSKPGSTTVTATSPYYPDIKPSFNVTVEKGKPVESISIRGVEEDVITMNPKEILGIICDIVPEDAGNKNVTVTLEGAGNSKEDWIASTYTVNYQNEGEKTISKFNELSALREGTCKLILKAQDDSGVSREYTINVVEQDRTETIDYTQGTIILNEEWFGHTNGGLNYITPEQEYIYQAYERENPGMSFGCTSQYGIIWNGKLIVTSKQAADGGDPLPGGGRLVVADANTLKRIGSIDNLMFGDEEKSGDGRSVVGATPDKIYVGTHQGIYIVDLNEIKVIGKINAGDNISDDLYNGQYGDMVRSGKYVYAVKQSTGTIVIDTETDEVVDMFPDKNVQSVTCTMDGNVWIATYDESGKASEFVCIDPETHKEIPELTAVMPSDINTVTCSWGSWRTANFTGCKSKNVIWFAPGGSTQNGHAGKIYCWEVGTDPSAVRKVFDMSSTPLQSTNKDYPQASYGTIRYDDRTGELIVMTTEFNISAHYRYNWTHFVDPETGNINNTVFLRPYYWFQSLPIFPDAMAPEITLDIKGLVAGDDAVSYDLTQYVRDDDSLINCINFRLSDVSNVIDGNVADYSINDNAGDSEKVADISLSGKQLVIKPLNKGNMNFTLTAESNGKTTQKVYNVAVDNNPTEIADKDIAGVSVSIIDNFITFSGMSGEIAYVYDLSGNKVCGVDIDSESMTVKLALNSGVYLIRTSNGMTTKIILK